MKAYKKPLVISLIISMLPCLIGTILWHRLPDVLPTSFGFSGEVNSYSRKSLVVFGLPVFMAATQFLCLFMLLNDPKKRNMNQKLLSLCLTIGNYLPKIKQNYTMGIKISWTLDSETNWNKTHRLAGWLWIGGGVLFLGNALIQSWLLPAIALVLMIVVPMVYSFILFKKGVGSEDEDNNH